MTYATSAEPLDRTPSSLSPLQISLLMLLAFALHAPVFFGPLLGEQDTARLVNDALLWQKGAFRQFTFSDYRYFVSAGYICLIRMLLPLGERLSLDIGYVLNGLNVLACVLSVIPLSRLLRSFLDPSAAFWALCVLLFIPTFWQGGLYGFPHMPALLFMLVALAAFERLGPHGLAQIERTPGRAGVIVACLTATTLLKADIYMSAIAAPVLVFRKGPPSWRAAWRLGTILAVPVVLSMSVSLVLLADAPNLAGFVREWNQQYPPAPRRLLSPAAVGSWMLSFGFVTPFVAAVGGALAASRGRRAAAVLILVWLALPLAFWSSRPFDSARHHFQSAVPAAIAVGLALEALPAPAWRPVVASLIVALNYWAFPASDSTGYPSGNLLGSGRLIRERVAAYHRWGAEFAGHRAGCKVVLGTNTNPYVDDAVLRQAQRVVSARRGDRWGFDTWEYGIESGGTRSLATSVVVREADARRVAQLYQSAGYDVFAFEYTLGVVEPLGTPICDSLPLTPR